MDGMEIHVAEIALWNVVEEEDGETNVDVSEDACQDGTEMLVGKDAIWALVLEE